MFKVYHASDIDLGDCILLQSGKKGVFCALTDIIGNWESKQLKQNCENCPVIFEGEPVNRKREFLVKFA